MYMNFLDELISCEQRGFAKGCHIHDNIMLVHKLAQSSLNSIWKIHFIELSRISSLKSFKVLDMLATSST